MAKIVFVGNCQTHILGELYYRFVGSRSGDAIAYLPSYEELSADGHRQLASADLVVLQALDFGPKIDLSRLKAGVRRHLVPFVTAAFLWPFATESHIQQPHPAFLPGGPYPAELGDAFLNRKIAAGIDPATAVEQYLDQDVARIAQLDRRYELVMAKQRQRDGATGYRMADWIEAHFRDEQTFLSPSHPGLRITLELASQLFAAMGASTDQLLMLQEQLLASPFPTDETPIHPGVCRHFRLKFIADPDRHRYRHLAEGHFTFREFARRYMKCAWNSELEEGIALARGQQHEAAIAKLRRGLAASPSSGGGHYHMGLALAAGGREGEAVAAFRQAAELDEAYAARSHNEISHVLADQGRTAEAITAAQLAVRLDPTHPYFRARLAMLLRRSGDFAAAEAACHRAIQLNPPQALAYAQLAQLLARQGRLLAAITACRRAIEIEPENAGFREALRGIEARRRGTEMTEPAGAA